jgi:class 3 adenylate cyclase
MAEPQIRYAKTSDGVNIAYATAGAGPPLVWVHAHLASHVQLEWEQPEIRAVFAAVVSGGMRLVRFDARGTGLSDRHVLELSANAFVRDCEAVVDQLQLDRFALLGVETGAITAIAYAALHPERVSRLLLMNPVATGAETLQTPRGAAFLAMADDWEMLTENVAAIVFGFGYEESKRYAAYIRACMDQETFKRFTSEPADVSEQARQIKAPTLVIRHTGLKWLSMESTRELVAEIPDARLVAIEGTYTDHLDQLGRACFEFLGGSPAALGLAPRDVHTILFTDIVGHAEMMSRLGDERGRDVLREHERITRGALAAHGGTELKTMGDGFMASFGSVTKAVECAIALQRAFAEREGEPLAVRVGLNAGEPIEEDGDLFGATVILASRIAAKADGGEILVADTVRGLCSGKGFLFADRGEFVAKGFEEPVRVYEVRWRE